MTRSENVARVRSKDTKPEMRVHRALWAAGLRSRLHVRSLPGSLDVVFASRRAVFTVTGRSGPPSGRWSARCSYVVNDVVIDVSGGGNMRQEILGVERRWRRTMEEKVRILAEVGIAGAAVAGVARRHDISRQNIYQWLSTPPELSPNVAREISSH